MEMQKMQRKVDKLEQRLDLRDFNCQILRLINNSIVTKKITSRYMETDPHIVI